MNASQPPRSVGTAKADIAAALAAAPAWAPGVQTVALDDALGRVLAADLPSPIDVPAHDNAAMDGHAFDGALLHAAHAGPALRLPVAGSALAGAPFAGSVPAGAAVRIMTGAVLPAGLDTVVPQELTRVADGHVHIAAGTVQAGSHVRRRGEDLRAGAAALHAGRVLQPADLGLVASLGLQQVAVRRRLRVALLSTGNELRGPGVPLPPGCIHDSNRASLRGALLRLGMEPVDLGLVADEPAALRSALQRAVACADAVLTSGGVSGGDADHTRSVLAALGDVAFWQVAMRPGRPFAFGALHADGGAARWLFALPGNPVAALVSFHVLVRDALLQLAGAAARPLPLLQARCSVAIAKRPGRSEFLRAVLAPAQRGGWQVTPTPDQGSGVLRSMSEANALLVLGHDHAGAAAGDWVDVWPFDGLS